MCWRRAVRCDVVLGPIVKSRTVDSEDPMTYLEFKTADFAIL